MQLATQYYLPNNQNKKLTTKTRNLRQPKQPRSAMIWVDFDRFDSSWLRRICVWSKLLSAISSLADDAVMCYVNQINLALVVCTVFCCFEEGSLSKQSHCSEIGPLFSLPRLTCIIEYLLFSKNNWSTFCN